MRWLNRWFYALLLLLVSGFLLTACQPASLPSGLSLPIVQVLSGQEVEVGGAPTQSDLTERIRLAGLEAPDLRQAPWGEAARTWLEETVGSQEVRLEWVDESGTDRPSRLAYVWYQGRLINEDLIASGHALAVPQAGGQKYGQRLAHAQERARLLGLGVWDPQNPMRLTPAEFRQQQNRTGRWD